MPFNGLPDTVLAVTAKQLKLIDILIDQLNNHGLFSNVNEGGKSKYTYHIALSQQKYPNSEITSIRANFNRINLSLHLLNKDHENFGTFRFNTDINETDDTKGTITARFHFENTDDEKLVEELKTIFYETELIYSMSDNGYRSTVEDDNVDINTILFVDLCKKYCGNLYIATRLSHITYEGIQLNNVTAVDFYKNVDLDKLSDFPGIGSKTITIIKQIYRF
jgi:hypothetical protein